MRVVLVTGASRGIGRAIAKAMALPDHFVLVNYRSGQSEAESVAQSIVENGGQSKAIGFDVSKTEEVQEAFKAIEADHGGVDVLVNNAGIATDGLMLRCKDEDWQKTIQTNLTGAFACSRAALKTMMKRKNQGRVINISSVVGQMGNAGQTMYAASKAGMIGLTKSLAREVASRAITVNAIAPGYVRTDMTEELTEAQTEALMKQVPLGRWAEPEEIASTARFLASSEAAYITGQVIGVNGGLYI